MISAHQSQPWWGIRQSYQIHVPEEVTVPTETAEGNPSQPEYVTKIVHKGKNKRQTKPSPAISHPKTVSFFEL